MNLMKRAACAALLLAFAIPALAAGKGPGAVRKQIEMSMVLTGKVRIAADGHVQGLQIDRESEVPAPVGQLIRGAVPQWKFDPAHPGDAADADGTPMSVRVVLRQAPEQGAENYTLRIVSAHFGESKPAEMPASVSLPPPSFPRAALAARLPATVYLVARIGRDGKVSDAFAEQVNLRAIGSERQMDEFRKKFADASLNAVKRWRFTPPREGAEVGADHWQVRVPVDFLFELKRPAYGQWEAYVPGPRARAPWLQTDQDATAGVDAFSGTGLRMLGRGPRLLTPLSQG